MRYIVFIDHFDLLPLIADITGFHDDKVHIVIGSPQNSQTPDFIGGITDMTSIDEAQIKALGISGEDRVVMCAKTPELFTPIIEIIGSRKSSPPIMLMTESSTSISMAAKPNISVINPSGIVHESVLNEWRWLEIRRKAFRLWSELSRKKKTLIMTQHDPDPDAIASGMAIQTLINGDDERAPICTLGEITRNENIAMINLLKTRVRTITEDDLGEFDSIVMVDVQPGYFKNGMFDHVNAVIDHHPNVGGYMANYSDVNEAYGATSTMMAEYLYAGGIRIPERLATALLYGVITDTMLLARDSSSNDFQAFNKLWPMANHQLLANISRPRLAPDELNYFVRAIENRIQEKDFLYIWLGTVKKEDIVPRLADFSLQIGETTISAVCGVYQGSVVISLRNMQSGCDVGALAQDVFSRYGSAGGHPSMAKAVMPLKTLKKELGIRTLKQVEAQIYQMLGDYLTQSFN